MGKSVLDYVKVAWNVFGKKAVNHMVAEKASNLVGNICSKYKVAPKHKTDLTNRIRNLVSYMVNCELEDKPIDNDYVSNQIEGPIAHSLAQAAYSSNNYNNMLSELINWLEDGNLDDIEKCLIEIGHKEEVDYLKQLKDMFLEVKNKNQHRISNNSDEHYDDYEILPEKKEAKEVKDSSVSHNETEKKDKNIKEVTSTIQKKVLSVKNGKIGPVEMLEMTKFFVDKTAEVSKFCEQEKTKRAAIRANTQVAIHQIDSIRMLLQDYLDRSFDERRMLFAKEFEIVDKCLETGNVQALAVSLNSITTLATSSPFKALADMTQVKNAIESHGTFDI